MTAKLQEFLDHNFKGIEFTPALFYAWEPEDAILSRQIKKIFDFYTISTIIDFWIMTKKKSMLYSNKSGNLPANYWR